MYAQAIAPLKKTNVVAFEKRKGLFKKEPDQIVIELSKMIFEEFGGNFVKISALSGLSATTIANIAYGVTCKPRASTLEGIMKACGYKMAWISRDGVEWKFETTKKPSFKSKK